jgi:transcriptional regulator with XRE-family HTH domain
MDGNARHVRPVADIEPLYKDLGRRIQEARDRAGMTQQEVADRLVPKVTRASVANMESGKQRILCHTLVALSAVLSTRPEELLPRGSATGAPREAETQEEPSKEIELELTRKVGRRATTNILTKLEGGRS